MTLNLRRIQAPFLALLGVAILLIEIIISYHGRADAVARASRSSGPAWRLIGLPSMTVHSVLLDPAQSGGLYAGTESGIYRRRPGGAWKQLLTHRTIWSLAAPSQGHTLLAADQNGSVDISRDNGATWRFHFLNPDGVFAVSLRPGHPRTLLAGAGTGLFLSRDGGRHWRRRLFLAQSAGAAFAWLPGSSRIAYAGVVANGAQGNTQVFISRDAGRTWHVYGRGLRSGGGIMSLGVSSDGQVLAGTMGHAIWSTSGGAWQQVATGMPAANNHVAAIVIVPGDPQQIVIGTLALGVLRSDNGGRSWLAFSRGLPAVGRDRIVLSLAYSVDRATLYAGTFSGVYSIPLYMHRIIQ